MPDITEIVNDLEGLLQAIKGHKLPDKDVAVLEEAKAAFQGICDNNAILSKDVEVKPPIKLSRPKPR